MNNDSIYTQVYETKNYNKFSFIKGNREIDRSHVEKLKKSIQKRSLLSPITINEDFAICEGQHRFTAWLELDKPIQYIVGKGYGIKETQAYNSLARNWNYKTLLKSFCDTGKIEYIRLNNFKEKYKFGVGSCLGLLRGHKTNRQDRQDFTNGVYRITDYRNAVKKANMIFEVSKYYKDYNRRYFVEAMLMCFSIKGYDHDIFMQRVKKMVDKLEQTRSKTSEYRKTIHEIYNYKTHTRNKLELRQL
tara:strand:+ start:412 stop:1149 length:738 start_codon:yes stop_codon:yes gene_type:complete